MEFKDKVWIATMVLACLVGTLFYERIFPTNNVVGTRHIDDLDKDVVLVQSDFRCSKKYRTLMLESRHNYLRSNLFDAEMIIKNILETEPSCHEAWSELAMILYLKQEYRDAEKIYLGLLREYPENKWLLSSLAVVNHSMANHEAALDYYKISLEIDDADASTHYGMASEYLMLGNYEKSAAHFEKSLQLDPHSRHADKAKKYLRKIELMNH